MPAEYCTAKDVLSVAAQLSTDVDDQTFPETRMTEIIQEATDSVRYLLIGRFNLSTIEAKIPIIVRDLTKIRAAILIIERYYQAETNENDRIIERFKNEEQLLTLRVSNGTILDDSGVPLGNKFAPESSMSELNELEDIYA